MNLPPQADSARETSEAQRLYERACALTKGEFLLHETQHRKAPSFWTRLKLKRAATLFKKVLALAPHNWASMWLLGKTLQRLGDERAAFDWLAKACEEPHNNANVPREASLSAMKLGLGRQAIELCEATLKIEPGNGGLICNLGLAYLHNGQPEEALMQVKRAIEADPADSVSRNVQRVIEHIIAKKAPCPKTAAELDDYCRKNKGIFKR
jgi:tetratricopeptide (TPR) repeat protein